MKHLGIEVAELEKNKGFWTAKEIEQQPDCWLKTLSIVNECRAQAEAFLAPLFAKENLRIVMTGAGTSAFAGKALAPILAKELNCRVEAIATTDIVSNPSQYFAEDIPTLLVSFARSGNSPESVHAVDLASQVLSDCFHLVVTCNAEGQLYSRCQSDARSFAVLMPAETNDKSFAMTSSFSSMMMAAFSFLTFNKADAKDFEKVCEQSKKLIQDVCAPIRDIVAKDAKRVIYLGSGGFQGLAQESALKLLELTAGKVVAMYDSPLGFRHGPKSIIDDETLIMVYISNDPYTRQYDLDLLTELRRDNQALQVVAVAAQLDDVVTDGHYLHIEGLEAAADVELIFPYLVVAQEYSFFHSLALDITPDNPCPTGEVNRVVQGVIIHPFGS
ncbi:SIS domain-containing protein [Vibrio cholerae]|nr:SIS domain-containing protein [Vibrio cholerae]